MLKTFLIDDEPYCTDVLRVLLEKYCVDVQVTGIFNDPLLALEAIRQSPPDLVLLDIEMPHLNGFDLLRQCGGVPFSLIFTTAYDQYAVKAFKFNALDYLLKPIDKDELVKSIEKARLGSPVNTAQIEAVQYLKNHPVPERIALPVGAELIFVEVADILYCASEGSYVSVFIAGQAKPIILSKSLREFEELLNNPLFFRIHASYLINLKYVKKIIRTDGGEIVMRNEHSLPVARAKKNELMQVIAKL
jgi:two-component system LytT family response regulator